MTFCKKLHLIMRFPKFIFLVENVKREGIGKFGNTLIRERYIKDLFGCVIKSIYYPLSSYLLFHKNSFDYNFISAKPPKQDE